MNYYGIDFNVKNVPSLDKEFIPCVAWMKAYSEKATVPFAIAVERNNGRTAVYDTKIIGTDEAFDADLRYVERLVKFMLWSKGGFRVTLCGNEKLAAKIKEIYSLEGDRKFDFDFMSNVYERTFEVISVPYAEKPEENEHAESVGKHLDGCRIGFDAGGSDRKVSAVIDGEPVYSEEVVWFPKTTEDPDYHFNGIVEAFKTAASKMPRVDGIGVSSAGVYVDNKTMVASLFLKVPKDQFDAKVKDIYIRAAKEIGDVPLVVANDGDVSALAGAMSLQAGEVMGMAMGTSEAVGYVDEDGNIAGWLNELAFAPVDLNEAAMEDEWSTDIGVGCKYFSQDAVIKLAPRAGIELDETLSLADKLKQVQSLMAEDDERAAKVFESIGCYLGHTLPFYAMFYDLSYLILLGRVTSGKGGDIVLDVCKKVLSEEYPELAAKLTVMLPDEKIRRVGQSVAAASLPAIK
ncbi:MAG: ROK family protein [Clostridia bacterium]|nr:ROK family protein [Clostridia bacterium]